MTIHGVDLTHDSLKETIWNICAPDTARHREEFFKETIPVDNDVICKWCGEAVENPRQNYCDKCRGVIEKREAENTRREVESELEAHIHRINKMYAIMHNLTGGMQ